MTDHDTLNDALLAVQQNLPHVGKDATADTGKFSYSYATLPEIHAALLPVLNANGLTWTVSVEGRTVLGCLSDGADTLTTQWPLPDTDDPQRLGSALTYARRYLLCALVGLTPDEDDDGRRAAAPPRRPLTDLTELIAEATAAGVEGDFDALVAYAEQGDQELEAAMRKIHTAMAEKAAA